MDENDVHLRERVTTVETDLKNEIKAREKLETVVDEIRDIVSEIRYMRLDLQEITKKVNSLEEKPAKRWESIVAAIIGAVAGGVGTAIVTLIFR